MAGSGAMEPDPVFRFRLVVAVARALPAVAHVGTGSLPQKVPGRGTGGGRDDMKGHTGRVCLVFLLLANSALFAAPTLGRPSTAQGPEAKTLVVFSAAGQAYSLGSELEFLKLQLERVATRLEALPVSEATASKMTEADYLVVFCPEPDPVLPASFLGCMPATNKP